MKTGLYTLIFLFMLGCENPTKDILDNNSSQEQVSNQNEANITVTFLDFNDFHAHLTPHKEEVRQDDGSVLLSTRGGIARTATKINELRDENTILMNIGDTYHGGAEAMFSAGNDIVDVINAIGFDIGVPGNWDFAYGPMATNARFANAKHSQVKRPNFLHLAANMKFKDPDRATTSSAKQFMRSVFSYEPGADFLKPIALIDRGGIKIGIIGISSDIVEKMYAIFAMNIAILHGEENYINLINTLSAKLKDDGADMIVVMSELGIQKDISLANKINKNAVNIFFSAHTHEVIKTMIDSDSGAKVVEAGDDTYLGELNAKFENSKLIDMQWKLHEITQDIVPDEKIQAMVQAVRAPYLKEDPNIEALMIQPEGLSPAMSSFFPTTAMPVLHHALDTVIAHAPHSLSRKNALESSYNNAYTDMLRNFTGSDVALTTGFRYATLTTNPTDEIWELEDNVLVSDEIHAEDVYRFLPVPSGLATGETTVSNLKSIIEFNLENVFSPTAFNQNGGWFDGYSGVSMSLNLSNPKNERLLDLEFETPKLDSDTITVTGCSRPSDLQKGILCSYSGFKNMTVLINPDSGKPFFGVDFMMYAFENGLLDSIDKRSSIQDSSNTLQWPNSPFVQPLYGAK